jgi:hypothetical protein
MSATKCQNFLFNYFIESPFVRHFYILSLLHTVALAGLNFLVKLGLSPSPYGESLSFAYTLFLTALAELKFYKAKKQKEITII